MFHSIPLTALISIHDVMPSTLPDVFSTIAFLESRRIAPMVLLVVPGKAWNAEQIGELKKLQQKGYLLGGHGWAHRVERIKGVHHTLHACLFSRNVAEHLALDRHGIAVLIRHCYDWFGEMGLDPPALYVPPAWAMGSIFRSQLRTLPFRYFEYFSGVYDGKSERFCRLPLVGYEADRPWRVAPLLLWNEINLALARHTGLLRIAIHPHDLHMRLSNQLIKLLGLPLHWSDYHGAREEQAACPGFNR
jgi:predicted deacetylase